MNVSLPNYSALAHHWQHDQSIVYLNHGSFGATPTTVLQHQQHLQTQMEAEAIQFFVDDLPQLINESKSVLAQFVGTSNNNIVFTSNTTTGINTIFNSLPSKPNDNWLLINHNYGACALAAKHYAKKNNCTTSVATIPYPINNDDDFLKAIDAAILPNTTVAMVDYITSASATIFPIKKIIDFLHSKNIQVIVDAAHAPGMVTFNIDDLQPDYFVANCHKWICSPKGSAFMYVAPQHQPHIYPLVISHYNDTAVGTAAHWSNQFLFDGTHDYSAYISVKNAIDTMPNIANGTWDIIKQQNHEMVWEAALLIANTLQVALPIPKHMVGSICNIPLPSGHLLNHSYMGKTALKQILFDKYKIEVPVFLFPAAPTQWLRISAQLYNSMEQYEYLAQCLKKELM
jgi:isopenicillin-N epimerase